MNITKNESSTVVCFWQPFNGFRNGHGFCPYSRHTLWQSKRACAHADWHERSDKCKSIACGMAGVRCVSKQQYEEEEGGGWNG